MNRKETRTQRKGADGRHEKRKETRKPRKRATAQVLPYYSIRRSRTQRNARARPRTSRGLHLAQRKVMPPSQQSARRAFPYCIIDDWNSLPAWFFDDGFALKHLQAFKVRVHKFLGGKVVFNPALARLRGSRAQT